MSEAMEQLWLELQHTRLAARSGPREQLIAKARAEARLEDELNRRISGRPRARRRRTPARADRSAGRARLTVNEEHPGSALSRGFSSTVVRLRWLVVAAWIAGAAAATIWLPGLDVACQPLGGLIPKNAEALGPAVRSAELFPIPIRTEIALVERRQDGLTEDEITGIGERAAEIVDADGRTPSRALLRLPIVNDPGFSRGAGVRARLPSPGSRSRSTRGSTRRASGRSRSRPRARWRAREARPA